MTGSKLREMRKNLNMYQTDLADLTGISQAAISAYENGSLKIPVKVEKLIQLALRGVKPVDRPDPKEMPPERIREIRRRYMLRRRRFGNVIGVSESAVARYETGERRPSAKVVGKLLDLDR